MTKLICGLFGLIVVWSLMGLTVPAMGEPAYTDVQVDGHHCLVVDPPGLSDDAPVVFLLHGLAGNATNLFGLIETMNLPPCLYVLPDAPFVIGDHAFAWYNFQTHDRPDIVRGRDYLFGLMRHFSTDGEKAGRARPIILMGFSQGGVMSLEAGLNYKGKVEAIASMSGYIWDPSLTLAKPLAPKRIPILMVHGTGDTVVPEEWNQRTVKGLRKAGYFPILKEFHMSHQITLESLTAVAQFLNKIMADQTQK